mgnify:CR=1 FL=1
MTIVKDRPRSGRIKVPLEQRQAIRKAVANLKQTDFLIWMAGQGFWEIRHYHVARTALSTYIESRCNLKEGVHFNKDMNLSVGVAGDRPENFQPPFWMKRYVENFPKASWTL